MSNDTNYTIRIEIDEERTLDLERFLNQALQEYGPVSRKDGVVIYEHMRNLGPACAERYEKDVVEILHEAAALFPGAYIEMNWTDEQEQEGSDTFYESPDSDDDSESEKESPDHIDLGVAERFLENPDVIDLSGASTIDDDAAEVLAKYQGELDLSGLTEISKNAEDAFFMHRGTVRFSSLTEISTGIARLMASKAVSEEDDMTFEFDHLTELSEECAEIIASGNFSLISLNSLTNISPEVISKLGNYEGMINLDGLTSISIDHSRAIVSLNAVSLFLGGIRELGDEVCEILSSYGGEIVLDNLEEVSPIGAQALLRSGVVVTDFDLDAVANE